MGTMRISPEAVDLLMSFYANRADFPISRDSKDRHEADAFQELLDASMVLGRSDWNRSLIFVTKVLPDGVECVNETVCSREVPVLKRVCSSDKFPITVDRDDVDIEVYMRLKRDGLISCSCADDRMYTINGITEEGHSKLESAVLSDSNHRGIANKIASVAGSFFGSASKEYLEP